MDPARCLALRSNAVVLFGANSRCVRTPKEQHWTPSLENILGSCLVGYSNQCAHILTIFGPLTPAYYGLKGEKYSVIFCWKFC